MSKFKFVKRFDSGKAEDGVWFRVEDEMENSHGRFLCPLFDPTTQRYRVTLERLQREYPKSKNGQPHPTIKAMGDDAVQKMIFVEMSLIDWEVEGADGKLIPFTKQDALEYFSEPESQYVYEYLRMNASDVRNYQPEEQKELPEGN
jgi:hypothetical protein